MKNKTFTQSIKCAFSGLNMAFKSEKNFKYYLIINIIFGVLNIIFKVDNYWWIGYMLTTCGVYSAELINTAMEKLADAVTTEIRNDIKAIKDIAAGAVLFWGFGFFTNEILAIGSKLI